MFFLGKRKSQPTSCSSQCILKFPSLQTPKVWGSPGEGAKCTNRKKKKNACERSTCSVLCWDDSLQPILTATLRSGAGDSISIWWIRKARFLEIKRLAEGHSSRNGEQGGWDLNPGCMKLDPECPPAPHNVYSRMHTCNGRFRTASKIEVGVESYSEATVSKYIHRSGTTLRAVVRGGVEWGVNYGIPWSMHFQ